MSKPEYTNEELEKIQQLRTRLLKEDGLLSKKFYETDAFLITWLRARNLNLAQAEDMLRKSLKWRSANKVDGIRERETLPPKYLNKIPFAHLGMEEGTGCPVFLFLMGRHDYRAIVEEEGLEATLRFNILFMEHVQDIMKENSRIVGHPVTTFVELMDLEGYSFRQFATRECREAIQQMQQMFDLNYPEAMKSVTIINAPKVFSLLFNFMKPLIPKATLEKIDILGPDVQKWKEVIEKKIPLELLPKRWGGRREGNDEFCSGSDIWLYGPLGPSYFSAADEDGFIKVKVKPRDKLHLEFIIEEENVHLEWKFKTVDHDISFGLTNESDGELIPCQRVESHKTLQEGRHKCVQGGKYTIIFDNTYSYTRSKTVYHKVEILDVKELLEPTPLRVGVGGDVNDNDDDDEFGTTGDGTTLASTTTRLEEIKLCEE